MRKLFTILIICIQINNMAFCYGKVSCEIKIDIIPSENINDISIISYYSNVIKIKQKFNLNGLIEDTLCFNLTTPSQFDFLNQLYFQKLEIHDDSGKKIDKKDYHFSTDNLRVIIPYDMESITLEYYYQPDYFMYGSKNMECIFCPVQHSWFSWYFEYPDMDINEISLEYPPNIYVFTNLPQIKSGDKTLLDIKSIPQGGISFFWFDKIYYEKFGKNISSNQFNIFSFKDINQTTDSTSCHTLLSPGERIYPGFFEKRILELEKASVILKSIFNKNINVDIVDACLEISQGDDKIRWGSAYLLDSTKGLIVMDTSYWNGHSCFHELVHFYNSLIPERIVEVDQFMKT